MAGSVAGRSAHVKALARTEVHVMPDSACTALGTAATISTAGATAAPLCAAATSGGLKADVLVAAVAAGVVASRFTADLVRALGPGPELYVPAWLDARHVLPENCTLERARVVLPVVVVVVLVSCLGSEALSCMGRAWYW